MHISGFTQTDKYLQTYPQRSWHRTQYPNQNIYQGDDGGKREGWGKLTCSIWDKRPSLYMSRGHSFHTITWGSQCWIASYVVMGISHMINSSLLSSSANHYLLWWSFVILSFLCITISCVIVNEDNKIAVATYQEKFHRTSKIRVDNFKGSGLLMTRRFESSMFVLHQEKSCSLLSTRFFTVLSPTKLGHLVPFHFWEVALCFWKCASVHF